MKGKVGLCLILFLASKHSLACKTVPLLDSMLGQCGPVEKCDTLLSNQEMVH